MSPQVTTIGRLSSLRLTLRNYSSSHHYYDDVIATGAALAASAVAVSSVALFMQSSSTSNETASIDDAVTTRRRRSLPINFSYASSNNNYDDESPSCTSAATKYYASNLLTSSQFTSCEQSTSNYNANNHPSSAEEAPLYKSNEKMVIECDYVVVGGHGKAGKSAINTIRKLDPTANIVTIDPNHYNDNNINRTRKIMGGSKINHLKTHASFIDHGNKVVQLHNTDAVIHFRKSVLLATGSRGSPPPNECIHQNARNRILELRSTSLPSTTTSLQQNNQMNQEVSLPVLDPPTVRSLSMMAASEGATVAIMGSGFEALELAASLSRMQQQQQRKQTNRGVNNGSNGDNNNDNKKVILIFGNAGPMTTHLPRYLSAAVTKRLRQCGIEVEERSMTRYISMESSSTTKAVVPQLELYTVKSYDNLDSRRITADLLVLAPNVDGATGTSVIPAIHKSYHYQQYLPWSSLISPPVLTSFLDDGKVVTNSEYQAASNIYAAGSVTRSPNAQNGRAGVAGGTSACSTRVGEIAARNMIQNELNKTGERIVDSGTNDGGAASIPVWRSDEVPYLHNSDERNEPIVKQTSAADEKLSSLALYSMGVHALCVGKCDSETQATHGFWWTNTNQQQSNNDDSNNSGGTRRMNTVGPNAFMRRITRKATSKVNSSKATGSGSLPVYGSGVVFYLDKTGSISGVMLWGLPFSQYPQDVRSGLNHLLVYRMKEVIGSNGHVAIRDHSRKIAEDQAGLNVDLSLLSFLHLVEESKLLASMALSGSRPENNVKIDVNGKPLHRYTPIKSSELSSLGKLKRREMGHVAEEDDLFYPTTTLSTTTMVDSEETTRPPSLKRIYPMHGGATTINVEKELELRQLLVDRGRPSKEEPLWIRQGEEHRFVNKREAMADNFYRNIQKGRFSDGTDAVKQAPVPQVYLDAKEQVKSWTGGSSSQNSEDVPEGEDDSRR
ncbi:hypothetical protein ACHAWC_005036 [Mediolabrus comicus]